MFRNYLWIALILTSFQIVLSSAVFDFMQTTILAIPHGIKCMIQTSGCEMANIDLRMIITMILCMALGYYRPHKYYSEISSGIIFAVTILGNIASPIVSYIIYPLLLITGYYIGSTIRRL